MMAMFMAYQNKFLHQQRGRNHLNKNTQRNQEDSDCSCVNNLHADTHPHLWKYHVEM